MPSKLAKTSRKGGRPSKAKQSVMLKRCQEEYEKYHTSGHTARILDLNRHTVEKYFRGFQEEEVEETNHDFILRQRSAKNRILARLDICIDKLDGQLTDIEGVLVDDPKGEMHDIGKYEQMRTNIIVKLSDILQQKGSIEITPTLDITIDKYLEERYGQLIEKAI